VSRKGFEATICRDVINTWKHQSKLDQMLKVHQELDVEGTESDAKSISHEMN
jgi:hypothetical protein